jgi:hypothetical protein
MISLKTLPIFPCAANKKPLTPNGFYDTAIGVDYSGWPLVGVRTGAASSLDVLDVDPEGLAWLAENEARLPTTRRHRTQRGVHLLFQHAEGLKKSEDRIATGIDVRADGGYAIWWPRQDYSVANEDTVAEWPGWLLELARAGRHGREEGACAPAVTHVEAGGTRDFRTRVKAVMRVLEQAQEGNRNACLYWSACRFAEIVAEGLMTPSVALTLLEGACKVNGLWRNVGKAQNDGPEACKATIVSAFARIEHEHTQAQEGNMLPLPDECQAQVGE